MKKIILLSLLIIVVSIVSGQSLLKGKGFESKSSENYYLLKTNDEIYYLNKPIASLGKSDCEILKYKYDENGISKENEAILNIKNKKFTYLSGGNGVLFGNSETKCFYLGFSQEFVDNSFTLRKGIRGRLVIEKYDLKGNLVKSLGVDKKVEENNDYFFSVEASKNGKYIGFINNKEYSLYNSDNFDLEKTFKLKFLPEKDKAKFYVLADGSLIFITLTNPLIVTKCDINTGEVKTLQVAFDRDNNFGAKFNLSEDEMFLTIGCNYNDQKNKDKNTIITNGIQILGIDLKELELQDKLNFTFSDVLLEKMEEKESISYLRIDDIYKLGNDYYIITDKNYTDIGKYSVRNYNRNILLIKISKEDSKFDIIKRDDLNAEMYTSLINGRPCILYTTNTEIKLLIVYQNKFLCLEIDEDLKSKTLIEEDFSANEVKVCNLSLNKIDEKNYFILVKEKDRYMPILLTF